MNTSTLLVRVSLFFILVEICLQPGMAKESPGGNERWVSTWATALVPADALDRFLADEPQFTNAKLDAAHAKNRTLREVVRVSIGGGKVRIRLSNVYGAGPLQVGAAHVAIRAAGAAIVPGTDRALSFSGEPSFRIPAGAVVVSDPVALEVPPAAELAISIHLPAATDLNSMHYTQATSFVSTPGNYTAVEKMPVERSVQAWHVLERVEVAAASAPLLVAFGDSITDGTASSVDAHKDWPAQFSLRLQQAGIELAVVNEGIGGNRILNDLVGPNALARFDRDVVSHSGTRYLVFLEGINDIVLWRLLDRPEERPSAADLIGGMKQLIARAHAHGIKVFGGTLLPLGGAQAASREVENLRQSVNQWIRSAGEFDAVIDFDAALRDPADQTRMLAKYSSDDRVHPNDAGYLAMAEAFDLKLVAGGQTVRQRTLMESIPALSSPKTANEKLLGLPAK